MGLQVGWGGGAANRDTMKKISPLPKAGLIRKLTKFGSQCVFDSRALFKKVTDFRALFQVLEQRNQSEEKLLESEIVVTCSLKTESLKT